MELAIVSSAIRRYWWLVAVMALLGGTAATFLSPSGSEGYTSQAILLIQAPSDSSQVMSSTEADRYVRGQVTVLGSEVLAERVAERVGGDVTGSAVSSWTSFTHDALTDVVHVEVTTDDPKLSQEVGNAYLDIYFESLRSQIEDAQRPEIEQLDAQIETLRTQLAEVDDDIDQALSQYLGRDTVPTIEQVAPSLASRKDVLLAQYYNVLETKNELETNARMRVSSEIVQRASLPDAPTGSSGNLLQVAGIVVGAMLGAFAAMIAARLSTRVLGDEEIATLLEHPVVGRLPYQKDLASGPMDVLSRRLPAPAGAFVKRICVRSAATGRDDDEAMLMVLVTGTQSRAGTTTLAAAMARQFAESGSKAMFVDADPRQRVATGKGGGTEKVSLTDTMGLLDGQLGVMSIHELGRTGLGRIRHVIDDLWDELSKREAEVAVIDGGALLESSLAVALARRCDVVVMTVPETQEMGGLAAAGRDLRDLDVLPVRTMRHQIWDRLGSVWARYRYRSTLAEPPVARGATPPRAHGFPSAPPLAAEPAHPSPSDAPAEPGAVAKAGKKPPLAPPLSRGATTKAGGSGRPPLASDDGEDDEPASDEDGASETAPLGGGKPPMSRR
ncbi:MAG: hypothetical protein KF906_07275 [Actinobacteria bacterium]|nr:hypothetical protein [Actinomycetota bacterium]